MVRILSRGELWLQLLSLGALSWRAAECSPGYFFYLNILLSPNKNIPHPGDVVLHQVFIEGIGDLQPADEGDGDHILVAVAYQGHLTLKIFNIIFQALPDFHLNCEEAVVVPLEFPLGSNLVKKSFGHLLEISE